MQSAKSKIKKAVKDYARLRPEDYKNVCEVIAEKRKLTKSKFGLLEGSEHMRALFEIPEDLHDMLVQALAVEELQWFKSGVVGDKNQGGRWFATTFPQFAIARDI